MTNKFTIKGNCIVYNDNLLDKQPMVFIHGLPTSKELFAKIASEFMTNYRTIAIDLLDYGESAKIGRHMEHKERAANLHALFKSLKLSNIVLISHDLGASIAIEIMGLCPELVSKLVIMSPPVYPDFTEPRVVKIVRSKFVGPVLIIIFKRFLLSRSIKKGLYHKINYKKCLKKYLEKAFKGREGSKALLRNLRWGRPAKVFANYPEIIKSIRQEVLILHGKNDPFIPIEHSKRMHTDIKQSKLVLLDNASHFLPIDVPLKVSREIKRFLDKL